MVEGDGQSRDLVKCRSSTVKQNVHQNADKNTREHIHGNINKPVVVLAGATRSHDITAGEQILMGRNISDTRSLAVRYL